MKKSNSIEERIWDWIKPAREFTADFVKKAAQTAYGVATIPLRVPTLARRFKEDTTYVDRIENTETKREAISFLLGSATGSLTGAGVLIAGGNEIVNAAQSGNYWPLAVIGTTNILSGIYEGIRSKPQNTLETQTEGK